MISPSSALVEVDFHTQAAPARSRARISCFEPESLTVTDEAQIGGDEQAQIRTGRTVSI